MENLLIGVILTIMLLILVGHALRKALTKRKPLNGAETQPESWETTDSMNAVFLKNAEGKPVVNLVKTYNPGDMAFLRSLLDSAEINTFVNFDAMNSLYPGINLGNLTDTILTIFEEDAVEARQIVAAYLEEQQNHDPEKVGSRLRNVAETVIGGYPMPSGRNKTLPELLI